MDPRKGTYISQLINDKPCKAYIPPLLSSAIAIDFDVLKPHIKSASEALADFHKASRLTFNARLFRDMYARKESVVSCQLEGIDISLMDLILFDHERRPSYHLAKVPSQDLKNAPPIDHIKKVTNYVQALMHGAEHIKKGGSLSLRLLRELHHILLLGSLGLEKSPVEFRRTPICIKEGLRPPNTLFIPPPDPHMTVCLNNLDYFLKAETSSRLIKAGVAHAQFDSIYPFIEDNGMILRLLTTLMLCEKGTTPIIPILCMSLYFKKYHKQYHRYLQRLRIYGEWEEWLVFFLRGITTISQGTALTIRQMNSLFDGDRATIEGLGRIRYSCRLVLEYMKKWPQVTVLLLTEELGMTSPTARSALDHMVRAGILKEVYTGKPGKIYVYQRYLSFLEKGTEGFH